MSERNETVIRSQTGWQGTFLRVQVDEVRLPSGRATKREYVDHPGAVAILPLTVDGDVLLIRQYRSPIRRIILEVPAGTREPGKDPVVTARRELAEEIAHEADSLKEIARFYSSPGYTNELVILYAGEGCRPVAAVERVEETIDLVRIPIGDVPRLLADPNRPVEDAMGLIALQWLVHRERLA
jgi:ADP-ribose pyrophosphatase